MPDARLGPGDNAVMQTIGTWVIKIVKHPQDVMISVLVFIETIP
jgi:hypothetical protein